MSDTSHTFQRQSSQLLRQLQASRGLLQQEHGQWLLFSPRGGGVSNQGKVDNALVEAMLRVNLLHRLAGGMAVAVVNEREPAINSAESPLVRLYVRKDANGQSAINAMQFAAGERLRSDYERAQMERRITSSWEQHGSSGGRFHQSSDNQLANLADGAIAARQRLHAACQAVGPELTGILYHVCCLTAGLEQAERVLAVPQRSGKAILGLALTRLARHYGLIKTPRPIAQTEIAHWAQEGYRPVIMPQEQGAHQP